MTAISIRKAKQVFKDFLVGANSFASSPKLFYLVIALTALQGMWYAMSVQPGLFDEARHIGFISYYFEHPNPIIGEQPSSADDLGQVSREPSYLYYYIMSLPLHILALITSDYVMQTLFLRLITLSIFILALFVYRRVFRLAGFAEGAINITLLLFIALPVVAPLPGVVTYDIPAMLLIGVMLYLAINIINSNRMLRNFALLIIAAGVASVIKYSTLAASIAIVIFVIVYLLKKNGPQKLLKSIIKDFRQTSSKWIVLLTCGLIVSVAIVAERPIKNIILYGRPSPSCMQTLNVEKNEALERCSRNYVQARNIQFLEDKPANFKPAAPENYIINTWILGIISSSVRQVPEAPYIKGAYYLAYAVFTLGLFLIIFNLRRILVNPTVLLLTIVTLMYVAVLYYANYKSYVWLGKPVAISARYLLPVLPIYLLLLTESVRRIIKSQVIRGLLLLSLLPLLLQGMGVLSYNLTLPNTYYWNNSKVIKANEYLKKALSPIIND